MSQKTRNAPTNKNRVRISVGEEKEQGPDEQATLTMARVERSEQEEQQHADAVVARHDGIFIEREAAGEQKGKGEWAEGRTKGEEKHRCGRDEEREICRTCGRGSSAWLARMRRYQSEGLTFAMQVPEQGEEIAALHGEASRRAPRRARPRDSEQAQRRGRPRRRRGAAKTLDEDRSRHRPGCERSCVRSLGDADADFVRSIAKRGRCSAGMQVCEWLDLLDALDVADALDAAELVDEAVEVTDVDGFDDEVDDCAAVGVGAGGGGADVGAVVGDDGGELLEQTSAVVAEDGEFDGVGLGAGRAS